MNVKKISAVADAIEKHEIENLGFNMNYEFREIRPGEFHVHDFSGHNCNTVACIAGWTVVLQCGADRIYDDMPIMQLAKDILDLDYLESNTLFMPGIIDGINYYEASQKDAVKVLRHLAKTGKVDWTTAVADDA